MRFPTLQSASQERIVEDFIPMPLFNENNSSLNSQSQSQPINSTPTSVLAPFPGVSSDSQSSSHTLPSSQQTEHERRGTSDHVGQLGHFSSEHAAVRRQEGIDALSHSNEQGVCSVPRVGDSSSEYSNLQGTNTNYPYCSQQYTSDKDNRFWAAQKSETHARLQQHEEGQDFGGLSQTRQVYTPAHGDTEPFLFDPHNSHIQQENSISCERLHQSENHGKQHTEQDVCEFGSISSTR